MYYSQRQLNLAKATGTGGTSVLKTLYLAQKGGRLQKDHRNSYRPTGQRQEWVWGVVYNLFEVTQGISCGKGHLVLNRKTKLTTLDHCSFTA